MKTLSFSRLCLVGALALGLFVVCSVATPQQLREDQISTRGGCYEQCWPYSCDSRCDASEYGGCKPVENDPGTVCKLTVGEPGSGCEGGPSGVTCRKMSCEDE